jgi:hypothetical protein
MSGTSGDTRAQGQDQALQTRGDDRVETRKRGMNLARVAGSCHSRVSPRCR